MLFFRFLISATVHGLYIGCTSQRRDSASYLVSFYLSKRGGGGMSRYCCVTAYVFSSCIRRFPDDSVIQNTESDLYSWFSHDVTLHNGTKQPVNWLVKKQHANGIEKYRALKYSPLILKLQVTFTKRLSFKTTFKGHSIITYLNHASTRDVINKQNQCQIWMYLKATCCVQQNIVLWDRVNLNFTEILKADTLR